ncbi:hypothetical protein [Staphylococcus epidermidis]|uniref:hypothetical protein n=1 Tax=Staphylococcus epidermidis TaxID=1282 RepID=UPI00352D1985
MVDVKSETEKIKDNFSEETYIELINLMLGLNEQELMEVKKLDKRKLRFKYKMALTQKTDELYE